MKLIGLTGGIASGKSLIADMLRKAKIPVVDADELSRKVTAPQTTGYTQVVSRFGSHLVLPDSSLDRKALAKLVFNDAKARADLEAILHPLIANEMKDEFARLTSEGHKVAVYSAPLIFEKHLQHLFDDVILVFCDEETQIQRLMARDKITQDEAKLRLSAQMPLQQKLEKTRFKIDNNKSPAFAAQQLSKLWEKLAGQNLTFV